jgi:AcrR family transcriptional regulator
MRMKQNEGNEEKTRDIILIRARELFLSIGYHQTTMRKIAQASGVSTGPLYFHFQNKAEILFHICLQGYRKLLVDFREVAGENTSSGIKLQLLFYAYWNFFRSEPELFEVLHMPENPMSGIELPKTFKDVLISKRNETIGIMEEIIRLGIEERELRTVDTKAFALFLFSVAEGVFQSYRSGLIQNYESCLDEIVLTSVRIIGHGMLNDKTICECAGE